MVITAAFLKELIILRDRAISKEDHAMVMLLTSALNHAYSEWKSFK